MEEEEVEDFVTYGTPLPDIEDEITTHKKAAKELEVRDEKGRQRFHGAFTGGFSAGYFNTVGTKEGWTPSSFISSRNKTADHIQQNPEDFMDDEDLGEFGIAVRKIHTTSNFRATSDFNSRKRRYFDNDAIIPGEAPLKDIVKPVSESIGIKILRNYGWREGQGIGPRVKKQAPNKVYGCSPFSDVTTPEGNDHMILAYTFAPEDTVITFFKPKDDYFGLGYTGLPRQSVLNVPIDSVVPTTTKSWLGKDRKKMSITGQAFGVGAFEDDDEDIYGKDDMSQYDFSDIGGKLVGEIQNESRFKPQPDGSTKILEGFLLASQPSPEKKYYSPPTIPRHFQPLHANLPSNLDHTLLKKKFPHNLSAGERSFILNEKQIISSNINVDKKFERKLQLQSLDLANEPLPTFKPFSNDDQKQQRYEEYVRLKSKGETEKLMQSSSMTEWEKQQEIEEFARASILFKPLSDALSSRFESKSHLSVEHEGTLEKIKKDKETKVSTVIKKLVGSSCRKTYEWHPSPLLCKRFNVPNPYPDSHSPEIQNAEHKKSLFDHLHLVSSHSSISLSVPVSAPIALEDKIEQSSNNPPVEDDQHSLVSTTHVSAQVNNDNSEGKRLPVDLFKDIFENSSSEDDTTKEETDVPPHCISLSQNEIIKSEKDCKSTSEMGYLKVTSIASLDNEEMSPKNDKLPFGSKKVNFGVFANIDFDSINQRTVVQNLQNNLETKIVTTTEEINIEDEKLKKGVNCYSDVSSFLQNDEYGPPLPPDYNVSSASNSREIKPAKHRKRKSKHKHHKHKSSKKKKKSSRKNSSKSDSSEDLDDVSPAVIIEKLKKLQRSKT